MRRIRSVTGWTIVELTRAVSRSFSLGEIQIRAPTAKAANGIQNGHHGKLAMLAGSMSRYGMIFPSDDKTRKQSVALLSRLILAIIVAVSFLVDTWPSIPRLAYAGTGTCMLISYLLPLEKLFFQVFWVKALVATLVLCSPVAFASIVFIRSFAEYKFSAKRLAQTFWGHWWEECWSQCPCGRESDP